MKTIILKRLFLAKGQWEDKRNKIELTSKYCPSEKRIVYFDDVYHKNTWYVSSKTFKTKQEAKEYRTHYISSHEYLIKSS